MTAWLLAFVVAAPAHAAPLKSFVHRAFEVIIGAQMPGQLPWTTVLDDIDAARTLGLSSELGPEFETVFRKFTLEALDLTEEDIFALTTTRKEYVQPLGNPDALEEFEWRCTRAIARVKTALRRLSVFRKSVVVSQIRATMLVLRDQLDAVPIVLRDLREEYELECNRLLATASVN